MVSFAEEYVVLQGSQTNQTKAKQNKTTQQSKPNTPRT